MRNWWTECEWYYVWFKKETKQIRWHNEQKIYKYFERTWLNQSMCVHTTCFILHKGFENITSRHTQLCDKIGCTATILFPIIKIIICLQSICIYCHLKEISRFQIPDSWELFTNTARIRKKTAGIKFEIRSCQWKLRNWIFRT